MGLERSQRWAPEPCGEGTTHRTAYAAGARPANGGRPTGGNRRDVRLVEVFLHASATLSAAAAAEAIGVRATTVHRWRATGGESISAGLRAAILAFLARWSLRSELSTPERPPQR